MAVTMAGPATQPSLGNNSPVVSWRSALLLNSPAVSCVAALVPQPPQLHSQQSGVAKQGGHTGPPLRPWARLLTQPSAVARCPFSPFRVLALSVPFAPGPDPGTYPPQRQGGYFR